MHDYPLNLKEINEQFQEQLVNCVNSSPRKKEDKKINTIEIVERCRNTTYAVYDVQLPEIDEDAASFSLYSLPGCCGVCVSCYSYIYFSYRGAGLGKLLNKIRIEMARQMKFGLLICTDVTTNVAQTKILDSVGWTKALDFLNPKTGHTVNLHYFKL